MRKSRIFVYATLLFILLGLSCSGPESDQPLLTAEIPLHLEEHLETATITSSEVPEDIPQPVIWSFDEEQPEWKALPLRGLPFEPTQLSRTDDALRVILGKSTEEERKYAAGAIYVDVPDWTLDDWAHVQVRARTSDKVNVLGLAFNLREESETDDENTPPFLYQGEAATVIKDGSIQTYSLRADWSGGKWEGKWRQIILYSFAEKPGSIDILSVEVIPKEADYAREPTGVRAEIRNRVYRRALYIHAPGRLEYQVRVPEFGRLDLGLGVLPTILDLLDLPMPEVMMGQSLAPLMLGMEGWEPRPVIFDEFWNDQDSAILRGTIEVVDGRWGASLEINPEPPDEDEDEEAAKWRRPVPLLLYDLWNDYHCLNSIHEERPDLVEKYTKFLEAQWKAHQALAEYFTRSKESPLTPEQLETLRSLGYIR